MPLSLKQQMAKTVAQMIVGQPERFSGVVYDTADYFLKHVDQYSNRPEDEWEKHSRSWLEFLPYMEKVLPVLLADQDTDARNNDGPQPETEQTSENEVNIDSHGTSVTPQ
jgi:hypothetical protein